MSKISKSPVIFFAGAATGIALETLFFLTKGSKTRKKRIEAESKLADEINARRDKEKKDPSVILAGAWEYYEKLKDFSNESISDN